MTAGQSELRDIFRAEDGSEWHAWRSHFAGDTLLYVYQLPIAPLPCPLMIRQLTNTVEGAYVVWTEKDLGDGE